MSRHDDSVSLQHMLDHAREAVAFIHNRSRSDLDADRMLSLALVRLLRLLARLRIVSQNPAVSTTRKSLGLKSLVSAIGWYMAMTLLTWTCSGKS